MYFTKTKLNCIIFLIIVLIASSSFSQFDSTPLFSDEFNSTTLDLTKWRLDPDKFRTDEVQCYTLETNNVSVDGQFLQLKTVKETAPFPCNKYNVITLKDYTSGSIKTVSGINNLGYGKYEARIKVPVGLGFFSAFWTLGSGSGWPGSGEVDIMESVGQNYTLNGSTMLENFVRGTCHWVDANLTNASNPKCQSSPLDMTQFHVYKVERLPNIIKWFVDDVQFGFLDILNNINGTNELHNNHAILLNLALGGWPPAPDPLTFTPGTMFVDWVRYYNYNPALGLPENNVNKMKVYLKENICKVTLPKNLSDFEATFYSMSGQKLICKSFLNTNEFSIDVSSLSTGNYILKVQSKENESYSGMFINQ